MMKKYNIYTTLLFFVLLVTNTGCSDYLEQVPDERLEVNSLKKVEAALVGAYQNSRSYVFTHRCTDNVTLAQNVFDNDPIIEDLYSWSRDFRNQTHQDAPAAYWNATYRSIANTNLVLESIEKLDITSKTQEKVNAIKGEALVMRSYNHFMLLNLFSKHYDKNTASSDLGVPYLTKIEKKLVVKYDRGTVEAVYVKAEKDLLDGIALLEKSTNEVNKNKYRFTFPSVYTYASRFYNFRNRDENDVKNTLKYANKALTAFGGIEIMRPWKAYKTDSNGPVDVDQQEVGMVQSSYTWSMQTFVYQMTDGIRDDELKKNPFGLVDDRFDISYNLSGDIFMPSFFLNPVKPGKLGGKLAADIFPLAEVIFNVAEASIRMKDFAKTKEMLEVIGKNVYDKYNATDLTTQNLKTFYKVTNDTKAWTKYLLFERRNMFLLRGFRWFDIKRYGLDVMHKLEDGKIIKLSDIAPNKDFQIPRDAIKAGMQANK